MIKYIIHKILNLLILTKQDLEMLENMNKDDLILCIKAYNNIMEYLLESFKIT